MNRKIGTSAYYLVAILTAALCVLMIPSVSVKFSSGHEVRGIAIAVDNSEVIRSNVSNIGYQTVTVKLLDKPYKGRIVDASNILLGKLDQDNFYKTGDSLFVVFNPQPGPGQPAVRTVEKIRQGWIALLFAIFAGSLIFFGRKTGLRGLLSFIITLAVIFFFLIPALLKSVPPVIVSSVTIIFLTFIIMFLVAGISRRAIAASAGTIAGLAFTLLITELFGGLLGLYGYTNPYSEVLLYSGHLGLNMRDIFTSSIVIGASGAAMDISMDVSTSMEEILHKRPDIGRKELIMSGFTIGRAVIGTMTTTLLLAYSGSYLTLLMLFQTLTTSPVRALNMKIVIAELLRTVSGSLSLVLVAPLTAVLSGFLLMSERRRIRSAVRSDDSV